MDLDDAWHMMLVEDCGNPFLLELIAGFMRQTRRYELALMAGAARGPGGRREPSRGAGGAEAAGLDGACEALHHNLMRGAAPIVAWLRARWRREAAV